MMKDEGFVRILHTSDWHLGVSIKQVDCLPEQEYFLNWLLEQLKAHAIDVLVVAGDIFHSAQPPNAARRLYYQFLSRCAQLTGLRKVVVVAGNHDSASGLDAPRDVLEQLNVEVVGALARDPDARGACLVPIANDAGVVEVVIAAVPYMPDAALGVGYAQRTEAELRQAFRQAFVDLYTQLADEALARWPRARLVATGHLTVYDDPAREARPGDFHTQIHRTPRPTDLQMDGGELLQMDGGELLDPIGRVGSIDPMDSGIFDPRFCYVALGHIHYPRGVGQHQHIRYSGTPVATAVTERSPQREVVRVDLSGVDTVQIRPLQVPCWREVFKLEGGVEEVRNKLTTLQVTSPLAPVVFIEVLLEDDELAGINRFDEFQQLLREHHEARRVPIIVEIREKRRSAVEAAAAAQAAAQIAQIKPIEEMTFVEVFCELYRSRYPDEDTPPAALIGKFLELQAALQHNE